jgi:endonuclease/exonuclease/phosphatase family metal-dependent hydrolase
MKRQFMLPILALTLSLLSSCGPQPPAAQSPATKAAPTSAAPSKIRSYPAIKPKGPAATQSATHTSKVHPFADRLEWKGLAIASPGYHVWGSSPVIGPKGKVHIFASRWAAKGGVDHSWLSTSEIAHYVADKPAGPFQFVDVALKGTGKDTWDRYAPCNPVAVKVDGKYVLFYIATPGGISEGMAKHTPPQRIGMATADSPNGPWTKAGNGGLILSPSTDPAHWTYRASNGVTNPAFVKAPNGKYHLYFKSARSRMGLAIADTLEGPYVHTKDPVTKNDTVIEDGYAFVQNGRFHLLTTDNHGILERGGGILWSSADGKNFDTREKGFHLLPAYLPDSMGYPKGLKRHYGGKPKFERPQILMIDGEPAWIYMPSGQAVFGHRGTTSYVLRIRSEAELKTLLAKQQAQRERAAGLTVLNYNVYNGFNRARSFKDTAAWIRRQTPQIVALQELVGWKESRLKTAAKSWNHPYAATLKQGGYNIGLTSSQPIEVVNRVRGGFHHGYLHCRTHSMDVIVTHLWPGTRRGQLLEASALKTLVTTLEQQGRTVILMGDFNAHSQADKTMLDQQAPLLARRLVGDQKRPPADRFIKNGVFTYDVMNTIFQTSLRDVVREQFDAQTTAKLHSLGSFPTLILPHSNSPRLQRGFLERIDFILTTPDLANRCTHAEVCRKAILNSFSDHYPIIAKFTYPPAKPSKTP